MDHAKVRASVDRQYEDFQPSTEWVQEKDSQTFIVYLSGFRKEQLKVQVTSTRNMRISGERLLGNHKWSRFREECALPSDCDVNAISAKFEGGLLYVSLPKKTTPEAPQEKEEAKPIPAALKEPAKNAYQEKEKLKSTPDAPKEHAKKAQQENKSQEHPTDPHPQPVASATRKEDKKPDKRSNDNAKKEDEKQTVSEKTNEKSSHEAIRDAKEKSRDGLAESGKLAGAKVELKKLTKSATDLAMGLKRPKAIVNLALGVLLAAVLMLYITNTIRFLGKPKDTIQ